MTTEIKYFTPDEAKNTLPLVKKIVADILKVSKEMRLLANDLEENIENNSEFISLSNQINKYFSELEEIGCYYKDWSFSIGLVDFPSIIKGEEVYLCWRSDEDDINYYHGINEGYMGRKKLEDINY